MDSLFLQNNHAYLLANTLFVLHICAFVLRTVESLSHPQHIFSVVTLQPNEKTICNVYLTDFVDFSLCMHMNKKITYIRHTSVIFKD